MPLDDITNSKGNSHQNATSQCDPRLRGGTTPVGKVDSTELRSSSSEHHSGVIFNNTRRNSSDLHSFRESLNSRNRFEIPSCNERTGKNVQSYSQNNRDITLNNVTHVTTSENEVRNHNQIESLSIYVYVLNRLKKEVTALLQEMFSQGKDCPLNPFRMLQRRFGYVKVGELTYVQVFVTTMYIIVNVSTRLYCWSYIYIYMDFLYVTFF